LIFFLVGHERGLAILTESGNAGIRRINMPHELFYITFSVTYTYTDSAIVIFGALTVTMQAWETN